MSEITYPDDLFDGLEEKYHVPIETDIDEEIICLDGLPIITNEKKFKLISLVERILNEFVNKNKLTQFTNLDMPFDDNQSKGFVFVTFTKEDVPIVCKAFQDYQLDSKHILSCHVLKDLMAMDNLDDNYVQPQLVYHERKDLTMWMSDHLLRDQFVILNGHQKNKNIRILWNNNKNNPELHYQREKWSDYGIKWSPKGSYLVTFHNQGIALWGTNEWIKLVRFLCPNVIDMEFSPNEKYIITYSNTETENIQLWDVMSGRKLMSINRNESTASKIKWSFDSQFIAQKELNKILLYQPLGELTSEININNLRSFSFSPTKNYLIYWINSDNENPARISVINYQTKEVIVTKTLFNIMDCQFYWQNEGKYVIVKVDKHGKNIKHISSTTIEILHINKKNIPVDIVETHTHVLTIDIEPYGDRFIINTNNSSIMYKIGEKITVEHTWKNKMNIIWSPKGSFLITYHNNQIEFWYETNLIETGEQYHCNNIQWDPSGRFIIASTMSDEIDAGFSIWNCLGKILYKELIPDIQFIEWRPRPKTLLTDKKISEIKKNLSKYSAIFEKSDNRHKDILSEKIRNERRRLFDEWNEFFESSYDQIVNDPLYIDNTPDQGSEIIETIEEKVIEETRVYI